MTDVGVTFMLNWLQPDYFRFFGTRVCKRTLSERVSEVDCLHYWSVDVFFVCVKASACKYPVWFAVIGAANMALRFQFGRNMVFVSFRCKFCWVVCPRAAVRARPIPFPISTERLWQVPDSWWYIREKRPRVMMWMWQFPVRKCDSDLVRIWTSAQRRFSLSWNGSRPWNFNVYLLTFTFYFTVNLEITAVTKKQEKKFKWAAVR